MERSKNRQLNEYVERHHIVPRCMGGTNCKDNLVRLTPEEHYVAHQLLVKIHPGHHGLVKAAAMMCVSSSGQIRNNKMYSWLRIQFAEAKSEMQKGIPRTEDTKRRISMTLEGHTVSSDTRKKISISNTGKSHSQSEETRQKISISSLGCIGRRLGKKNTDEHKRKISESIKEWHKNRKNNG